VASQLGAAGARLDQFAGSAFVHAMHVTTVVSAVITLLGAIVVLIWMPGRPAAGTVQVEAAVPVPAGVRAEADAEAAVAFDTAGVER
jgi:hypothetical protein